ncbi:MAG: hypothetical protein NWQ43_16060, partial [Dolichospermum sp.]|nr:hypothetical protein [Dolichospermum sp.]
LAEYRLIFTVGCISHKFKLHQVLCRLNNIATLSALITALPLCYEVQEPHPQPPPISKVYPFLPPAAGGLRGVR